MICSVGMKHFCLLVQKCPSPGGYLRDGECRAATSSNWRDANSLLCKAGPLRILLGMGAFLHKKAKMLPPIEVLLTPPPIERKHSDGGGFLGFTCSADLLHGH